MKPFGSATLVAMIFSSAFIFIPVKSYAVVIYSNGFENGLPVIVNDDPGEPVNGACSFGEFGGTNRLQTYRGCASIVPTASIGSGSGSFVAWAEPGQTFNDTVFPGSTLRLNPEVGLVDGWTGRYELSFNGLGVRELVFVDELWAPFGFNADGPAPQEYRFDGIAGTDVTISGNDYLIEIDLAQRRQFFLDNFGSANADEAFTILCISGSCSFPGLTFAIDSGGWLDNIEIDYLGSGQDTVDIPEPSTIWLLMFGLTAITSLRFGSYKSEAEA